MGALSGRGNIRGEDPGCRGGAGRRDLIMRVGALRAACGVAQRAVRDFSGKAQPPGSRVQATRSRISTAKKPKAAISVHFSTSSPMRL